MWPVLHSHTVRNAAYIVAAAYESSTDEVTPVVFTDEQSNGFFDRMERCQAYLVTSTLFFEPAK
jgi:hypothetical protein